MSKTKSAAASPGVPSSSELTIDWSRCVHITGAIDDAMVTTLTPQILALRQASNAPITVAINSHGGSLAAMDVLNGLLTGPDQDGRECAALTVVTHRAFSAAANMLASGRYAVALPHASVLFHDVRYGGMQDVTPDKAKIAARQLQSANEKFALKLANHAFRRMTWLYIDRRPSFDEIKKNYKATYEQFKGVVEVCGVSPTESVEVDLAAFVALLHSHLSVANEELIDTAMRQLQQWGATMLAARAVPMYRTEEEPLGLLDGLLDLYNKLGDTAKVKPDFGAEGRADDLRLFLIILASQLRFAKGSVGTNLEQAISDLAMMESINDPSHMHTAARLMLRHKSTFFSRPAQEILEGNDSEAKAKVMAEVQPYVRAMWHFCVLLCRNLFSGDHTLSPREALMLGLVDEVPGDSTIETRRQFRQRIERSA